MSKPKVPNTISDKKMADLRRRALTVKENRDVVSRRSVSRRLASNANAKKARWS